MRDSMDRFMGCSFRSVSIRSRLEVSFEDRFQSELECPLDHAITDGRDRQDSDLGAAVLRYLFLPYRHGPIRLLDQFVLNLLEKSLQSALFDRVEGDPIDARGPVVLLRHLVGFLQSFHFANMNVQSPETPVRFSLRLVV